MKTMVQVYLLFSGGGGGGGAGGVCQKDCST